jgi:hypothetical protein
MTHAWKHWVMGAGFFGFGIYMLLTGGSLMLVGLSVVAAAYLFYRAFTEQTGEAGQDLELAVNFVRNPYETLFDEAVARLDNDQRDQPAQDQRGMLRSLVAELGLGDDQRKDDERGFDADAAIERYLANRPAEAAAQPPYRPAAQGFGRKRA